MKTKENVTVYHCDFCPKKLFVKSAMTRHEKKCSKNPINIRACFDCINCEEVIIKYERSPQTYPESELVKSKSFKCIKKNIFMFPPKLEHSQNGLPDYVEHRGEEIIQEKMPLNCEIQQSSSDSLNEIFGWNKTS